MGHVFSTLTSIQLYIGAAVPAVWMACFANQTATYPGTLFKHTMGTILASLIGCAIVLLWDCKTFEDFKESSLHWMYAQAVLQLVGSWLGLVLLIYLLDKLDKFVILKKVSFIVKAWIAQLFGMWAFAAFVFLFLRVC